MLQWSDLLLEQGELAHGPLPHVQDPHQGGRHHHQAASHGIIKSQKPVLPFCWIFVWYLLFSSRYYQCCRSGSGSMLLGLPDPYPDPLVTSTDPPTSIIKQKNKKNLDFSCFVTFLWLLNFDEWCKCTCVPNPHPDPYSSYVLGLPDLCPLVRGTDPWIRIRINMSRIPNTVRKNCIFLSYCMIHRSNNSVICTVRIVCFKLFLLSLNPHKRHPPLEKRCGAIATKFKQNWHTIAGLE
jgi:hypothetical protein